MHVPQTHCDQQKSALILSDYHLPALRVAQATAQTIGRVYMIPNHDLGSIHPVSGSIHSARKPELGKRVALATFAAVYGQSSTVVWSGPEVLRASLLDPASDVAKLCEK